MVSECEGPLETGPTARDCSPHRLPTLRCHLAGLSELKVSATSGGSYATVLVANSLVRQGLRVCVCEWVSVASNEWCEVNNK